MKKILILLLLATGSTLFAQDIAPKPAYCDEGPATYGSVAALPGATTTPPLPRFSTMATKEYKVQVAILRYTDPSEYPFHSSLVARYRPCEQVWVVESRESFANRSDAAALQTELKGLGYGEAYITELMGYQAAK